MSIDFPFELDSDYKVEDLKLDLSILLYQRRKVSVARAARWLGMTRLDFQKELADRKIPINFTIDDFNTDLESLQSML